MGPEGEVIEGDESEMDGDESPRVEIPPLPVVAEEETDEQADPEETAALELLPGDTDATPAANGVVADPPPARRRRTTRRSSPAASSDTEPEAAPAEPVPAPARRRRTRATATAAPESSTPNEEQ
jgi:hypothetical protein